MVAYKSCLNTCPVRLSPSSQWTILLSIILMICSIFIFKGSELHAATIIGYNSQIWVDTLMGIKIHFTYDLNKPRFHNLNQLNFTVQDVNTNKNLKNLRGKVVVLNSPDPTFEFDNLTTQTGSFSIICPFLNDGIHQVIINIHDANNFAVALASFRIYVPPSSS